MASKYVTFDGKPYELSTSMRTVQKICNKYKKTTEQLLAQLAEGLPAELIDIMKTGLVDHAQALEFEGAIMDGDCGMAQLRNTTASYLLELTYPGTSEDKEASIDAMVGADETAKNGIRALLGLPTKHSEPSDSGSN